MLLYLLIVIYVVGVGAGLYALFQKHGYKGYEALVPGYNTYILVKIVGRPLWWAFVIYVPIAGFFIWLNLLIDIANTHRKITFLDHAAVVLLAPITIFRWAKDEKVKFVDFAPNLPKLKKTQTREWADAIGFAVIAATFIRWSLFEAFTIPTPSMERSLLVGDFLFVSKIHYGPRTPMTPLQMPLTHQKIWGTELPSFLDIKALRFPQFRLPGFTTVKRNDVVVFNYPADSVYKPTDLKTNYIKRCIAEAGDTIQIKDLQVYINGKVGENPVQRQFAYDVYFANVKDLENYHYYLMDIFKKFNVSPVGAFQSSYRVMASPEAAEQIKTADYVVNVKNIIKPAGEIDLEIFPHNEKFKWNVDNFGPLWIPQKGATIKLDEDNVIKYASTIKEYEGNENVEVVNNEIKIDGKKITEYTFKQNYYFMMGDNRHNSMDSRYWGFVPEDHVVGKAALIWLSMDNEGKGLFGRIRFKRFLNIIK